MKVKHSQLITLLVLAKLHTYPCDSNLVYKNFVTFAVSLIIAHPAIMAASTGIAHSVTSITCSITTYSNTPLASSFTPYSIALAVNFNAVVQETIILSQYTLLHQ